MENYAKRRQEKEEFERVSAGFALPRFMTCSFNISTGITKLGYLISHSRIFSLVPVRLSSSFIISQYPSCYGTLLKKLNDGRFGEDFPYFSNTDNSIERSGSLYWAHVGQVHIQQLAPQKTNEKSNITYNTTDENK